MGRRSGEGLTGFLLSEVHFGFPILKHGFINLIIYLKKMGFTNRTGLLHFSNTTRLKLNKQIFFFLMSKEKKNHFLARSALSERFGTIFEKCLLSFLVHGH